MRVNWKNTPAVPSVLYFKNLAVGDSFRNLNGHGAVYTKVELTRGLKVPTEFAQLEVETGKVFPPTSSPVELVTVDVNIAARKPTNLYSN